MIELNKIYNMDFKKGLTLIDKHIDLIATDPPYNINFSYNTYKDNLSEDEYIEMLCELQQYPLAIIHYPEEAMKYFVPALGIPDEVIAWCYNSNISRQFRLINFYNCNVDFNKVKQPYKNPNDKRVKKLIAKGNKGTRMYDWFNDIQLVKNVSKEKTEHPCQVPIELMKRIILLTTNENDLVVDTFLGSGTTALACMEANRNFIGFEIDKKYYNIAKDRINTYIINNKLNSRYKVI